MYARGMDILFLSRGYVHDGVADHPAIYHRYGRIIRHLRRPGDTAHYLPRGGMFRYVTSANYFGEIVEWTGFAILTWSLSGTVFVVWTFANLVPRANTIYHRYLDEFGDEVRAMRLKRVIPFIN